MCFWLVVPSNQIYFFLCEKQGRNVKKSGFTNFFSAGDSDFINQFAIIYITYMYILLTRVRHSVIMRMTMIWRKWRFLHALLNQVV